MALYEMAEGCWFTEIKPAWLFLVRAGCACGHWTRPYVSMDGAANALIRHQAEAGTRVA